MSEAETTEGPTFNFTTTVGGYIIELGDTRSVKLHLGTDQLGLRRWAVGFTNCGNKIELGLSDEAMLALAVMSNRLLEDESAAIPPTDEDMIAVPRGLLGSALHCVRKHAGADSNTHKDLSALALSGHPLARMVAIDEAIEAEQPGWMTDHG